MFFFILLFCLLQEFLSYWTVSLSKYVELRCDQDSRYTENVTFRRVRVTIVAVKKQYLCLCVFVD